MRILVTISRDWDDCIVARNALASVLMVHDVNAEDCTVVHGASQMDWFLAGIAYELGMNIEAHIADWKIGKHAGMLRNQGMVDRGADLCLAFIKNYSRGASDCAARAERAGIETRRYTA